MKKTLLLFLTIILVSICSYGQESVIKLLQPDRDKGKNIMNALADRKSTREFSPQALELQDLSNLLWAACGVNRPDGKRTAPTARNMQEITVYAIMPEGAYRYEAKEHQLTLVKKGDFRSAVAANQDFVKKVPVALVIVADTKKFNANSQSYAWVDGGIVSQNINLFCAGVGLVTVPRGFMDKDKLREILDLEEGEELILNNPVGYPLNKD